MPKNWTDTFNHWSRGPADTEATRCENAITGIRNALAKHNALANVDYIVFLQGSYKNRVNVRQNSDVDICVACRDSAYRESLGTFDLKSLNLTTASYGFIDFKRDVEQALSNHFPLSSVTQGNKAFDIKANSYRVEADVAVFFNYFAYQDNGQIISGYKMKTGDENFIVNFPDQHYANGVTKNTQTSKRYKKVVRILKNLKNLMQDEGYESALIIPGFLLECAAFNVPNDTYAVQDIVTLVHNIMDYIQEDTNVFANPSTWTEVSGLKLLFSETQPWNQIQLNSFIREAKGYLAK
ncbi:MAG: nucleotidyltransferase [Rhizobiales bacterium]|nr:nucleotidyltransferase [Hyphomicrobiales bacterium]NRB15354.1 nucleotidyltransferase [Hyphomicrobiales bacterium]